MSKLMSASQAGPSGPGECAGDPGLKARLVADKIFMLIALLGFSVMAAAQTTQPAILQNVGFDQKLGDYVPLDAPLIDETGRTVHLADYFHGRPVVLTLVYYECPMLCNLTLNGMSRTFNGMNYSAGQQFDVVTISFDPRETTEMAAAKKATYLRSYRRPSAEAGWHFLTAPQDSIHRIADAVGFRYAWDEKAQLFAHASGIMVLTPAGKISRYFFGVEFEPQPLEQAIADAASGETGPKAEEILYYCFLFDPTTGKYGLIISRALRLGGVVTLLALASFISINVVRDRRRRPAYE
jgi:protein SCO1/2